MTEVSEKKDVQKLQRIVVDSLEDVKAQDIAVFNTEPLLAPDFPFPPLLLLLFPAI